VDSYAKLFYLIVLNVVLGDSLILSLQLLANWIGKWNDNKMKKISPIGMNDVNFAFHFNFCIRDENPFIKFSFSSQIIKWIKRQIRKPT